MKRYILMASLAFSGAVFAEGRCPPGQYPVGSESGVQGCAPIPGAGGPGAAGAPVATGQWETRWGALAQDAAPAEGRNLAIGVAASKVSRREAKSIAIAECQRMGGGIAR